MIDENKSYNNWMEIKDLKINNTSKEEVKLLLELDDSGEIIQLSFNIDFDNVEEYMKIISCLYEFKKYFCHWTLEDDDKLSNDLRKEIEKKYIILTWDNQKVSIHDLKTYLKETKLPSSIMSNVNELCSEGEIEVYRTTVFKAVIEAKNNEKKFRIISSGGNEVSDIEPNHDSEGFINLPLNKMEKGLPFLWILFHEIGHACDPEPLIEQSYEREVFAWSKAEELLEEVFTEELKIKFEETKNNSLERYYTYFKELKRS